MKKCFAVLASVVLLAAFGENLVREDMRDFEVPFKGEGKMGMQYVQVRFPSGTEGAVISAEVKIEGVKKGAQSWFDARIMTDFLDAGWKKLKGGPNIGGWSGTKDWFSVRKSVKVPEGAIGMAVMPCLFNVKSGAMSVRNLCVEPQEKYEELPEEKAAREERERKAAANVAKRRAAAKDRLGKDGSLVPPAKDGELYVDLVVKEPGKMVNGYREYDLPEGVDALKCSWSWLVSD